MITCPGGRYRRALRESSMGRVVRISVNMMGGLLAVVVQLDIDKQQSDAVAGNFRAIKYHAELHIFIIKKFTIIVPHNCEQ